MCLDLAEAGLTWDAAGATHAASARRAKRSAFTQVASTRHGICGRGGQRTAATSVIPGKEMVLDFICINDLWL